MLGAVPVPRIEADLHPNAIADLRAGRPANITVQIQVETPVADRHHVDAPRHRRLAVDAHETWKRLAPAGLDGFCLGGGYGDVRVGVAEFYDRWDAENCHWYIVAVVEVSPISTREILDGQSQATSLRSTILSSTLRK